MIENLFKITVSSLEEILSKALHSRENRYKEITSDAEPTVGKDGRLHAPHDGYLWIDDNTYAGGEYLPEISGHLSTKRYLISLDVKENIENLTGVDVSFGETFNGNFCYAYVKGPEYLISKLPSLAEKIVVPIEWNLPTGKTWKFSQKKWLMSTFEQELAISPEILNKKEVGYFRPYIKD